MSNAGTWMQPTVQNLLALQITGSAAVTGEGFHHAPSEAAGRVRGRRPQVRLQRRAVGDLDDYLPRPDGDVEAGDAARVPDRVGDELAHDGQHVGDHGFGCVVFDEDVAGGLPDLRAVDPDRETRPA
nr:hypothetical protein [Streptomyces sp. fd1-xmd]